MNTLRLALLASFAGLALAACSEAGDEMPVENGSETAPGTPGSATGGDGVTPPPTPTPTETGDQSATDECGASRVARFVGQEATPEVRAEVQAEVGHGRIRWVGPDTVVTMDFRPDRLNMALDREDVITGASCS